MKKLNKLTRNIKGGINATFNGNPYTLSEDELVLADEGQFGVIAGLSKTDIDLLKCREITSNIATLKKQLQLLDLPIHTLTRAILGDTEALAKLAATEVTKKGIRAKLK